MNYVCIFDHVLARNNNGITGTTNGINDNIWNVCDNLPQTDNVQNFHLLRSQVKMYAGQL